MIERYLRELERQLPRTLWRRKRILAEAEEHLREAAAAIGSEEEAVVRFGSPDELAAPFRARHAATAAVLVAAGLLVYPILSYPVIESSLPPAPWPEGRQPGQLAWKQDAVAGLAVLAVPLGLAALASLRRFPRAALALAGGALGAMGAGAVLGVVLARQWADAVPGTPEWLILVPLLQVALVAAAAAGVARALTSPG